MNKQKEYEQELADIIQRDKKSLENDRAIFEQYGPLIKKMNKKAYNMFKSGYEESVHWNRHGISMASEALGDHYRRVVNRSEAARKAAATRKANKEKSVSA